ncbi:MAG: MoaD/ThiS family protein [Promethearchaeota archaeon]
MIEVHLYGILRKMVKDSKASEDTVLKIDYHPNETFQQFIHRVGLQMEELGDCFINGKLAKPDMKLQEGDRVGLFPFNMVLLCGGQHLKVHGKTQEDLDIDYY